MLQSGATKSEEIFNALPHTHAQFSARHAAIADSYAGQHCGVIADEMAVALIRDGKLPWTETVYQENLHPGGPTEVVSWVPTRYAGKMEPWRGHIVCVCDGFIFDPILERPVKKEDYTRAICGQEIAMKEAEGSAALRQRLEVWGKL